MKLKIGSKRYAVESLKEASAFYSKTRDDSGEGASTFPTGIVFDNAGKFLARVSYNGRLWALNGEEIL